MFGNRSDLVLATAKAILFALIISLIPGVPASASATTYTATFDLAGYDHYQQAPAPIVTESGGVVTLPGFSYPDTTFSGWLNGSTVYQPGDSFTLAQDETFTASFGDVGDFNFRSLTVTSSAPNQLEFFPAFDPSVTDYYLNIGQQNFEDISIGIDGPFRGQVVVANVRDTCGTRGLVNNQPQENASHYTFSLVVLDFADLNCSNGSGASNYLELEFAGRSERTFNLNEYQYEIVYTIHITRELFSGYPLNFFYQDLNQDVVGDLPQNRQTQRRYFLMPEQGNLSRPGFVFEGWLDVDQQITYQPGDLFLLNQHTTFEPIWRAVEPAAIEFFTVQEIWFDPQAALDYRVINAPTGISTLSIALDTQVPYRLTLFDNLGQVVSRYSDHPSYSASTVNATSTSMQAPPECSGPNMASCPLTFSMLLEYWDELFVESASNSYQIMITTSSGEVCAVEYVWHPLDPSDPQDPCDEGGTWIEARGPDFYHNEAGYTESDDLVLYTDPDTDDVYVFLGYSLDPEDDGSGIWEAGEHRPIFSDTEIYSIWELDAAPEISDLTLFGRNYEVQECASTREDQSEIVKCLNVPGLVQEQNWPVGPDASTYFLAQEVTTTSFAISFSNSSALMMELFMDNADLSDGGYEDYPELQGSSYSVTIPQAEFYPQGQDPAIFYIHASVLSKYGSVDRDIVLRVLISEPQNMLTFGFGLDGGTGVDIFSYATPRIWVTTPWQTNAYKPGFRADGWVINSGPREYLIEPGAPAPILFDNQTISAIWVPTYRVKFVDGFTASPIVEFFADHSQPGWNEAWSAPDAVHPDGNPFLGWATSTSSEQLVAFDSDLSFDRDTVFYPVWGDAPVVTPPNQNSNPPQPPVITPVTTSPPASSSSSVSPTTSTAIGVLRVNGMTQVLVALPEKYVGKTATIEVKRWVNNRVRYYLLDASFVVGSTTGQSGRGMLQFGFKLDLRPNDTVRVKVGRVEVLKKKVGQ
jgi:hypothetical protein